jgi:hypothetical protein
MEKKREMNIEESSITSTPEKEKEKKNKSQENKRSLFISDLKCKSMEMSEESWLEERIECILNNKINIEDHILTSQSNTLCTMQLMEDEEELVINCLSINHNTYLEYLKDNRDYIITLLIETTRKILHIILDNGSPPLNNPNLSTNNTGTPNA